MDKEAPKSRDWLQLPSQLVEGDENVRDSTIANGSE
jgi:hypothetical protein